MRSLPEVLNKFYSKWVDAEHPFVLVGAKIKKDRKGPYISVLYQSDTPEELQKKFPESFEGFRLVYAPAKSQKDLNLDS